MSSFSDPGIWVEFASDNGNGTGDPGPLMLKDPGYAISHLLYNLVLVEGHGFTFVICSYPVILLILESLWNSIKIKQLKKILGIGSHWAGFEREGESAAIVGST